MRRIKITKATCPAAGAEVFVEDNATAEDIYNAVYEYAAEYLDISYEESTEEPGN